MPQNILYLGGLVITLKPDFVSRIIECTGSEQIALFGNFDEHVKLISDRTAARLAAVQSGIEISGDERSVSRAGAVIEAMMALISRNEEIDGAKVALLINTAHDGQTSDALEAILDVIAITSRGRPVKCRTLGQKKYMQTVDSSTVTIAIGPAGTGKTYLAIAKAVVALKKKEVAKIILTRPAIEAGEKLGFLPGDLQSKVDPYLRPLYDALYDFLGADTYARFSESNIIEVAPLAYMRGRTLSNAFIILDEAQNCTMEQLKMFLTRFGEGSKIVVNGDVTQIDLPERQKSGLKRTAELLTGIDGIGVCYLSAKDVVRHRLVREILLALDKYSGDKS